MLKIGTDTLFHVFKEMARNKLQLVSLGPWLNLTGRCHGALNWTTNLRPEGPSPHGLEQLRCSGHLPASVTAAPGPVNDSAGPRG